MRAKSLSLVILTFVISGSVYAGQQYASVACLRKAQNSEILHLNWGQTATLCSGAVDPVGPVKCAEKAKDILPKEEQRVLACSGAVDDSPLECIQYALEKEIYDSKDPHLLDRIAFLCSGTRTKKGPVLCLSKVRSIRLDSMTDESKAEVCKKPTPVFLQEQDGD